MPCRGSRSSGPMGCAVNVPWRVGRRPVCWRVLCRNDDFPTRLPTGDSIAALRELLPWQHSLHASSGERKVLTMPPLVEADTGDPGDTYTVLGSCSSLRVISAVLPGSLHPHSSLPFFSLWSPLGSLLVVFVTVTSLSS